MINNKRDVWEREVKGINKMDGMNVWCDILKQISLKLSSRIRFGILQL